MVDLLEAYGSICRIGRRCIGIASVYRFSILIHFRDGEAELAFLIHGHSALSSRPAGSFSLALYALKYKAFRFCLGRCQLFLFLHRLRLRDVIGLSITSLRFLYNLHSLIPRLRSTWKLTFHLRSVFRSLIHFRDGEAELAFFNPRPFSTFFTAGW